MQNIKKDFETTREIKPQSPKAINEEFSYNLYTNNCVHWVIKKLFDIGIEVIDIKEWIPDAPVLNDLKESFPTLKTLHSTFLKFQNIDEDLETIEGAKAFRAWARTMIDNNYICYVNEQGIENKIRAYCKYCKRNIENQKYYESIKQFYTKEAQLQSIYNKLNTMLNQITSKLNDENLKGNFELIYFDKEDRQVKLLKSSNDYTPIVVDNFNLSIPANHFSISKFYPFIFTPKDKMQSRVLYHQYDYNICEAYEKDRNEFYKNILAGMQSDEYWSLGYHKLLKNNKQFHIKETINA